MKNRQRKVLDEKILDRENQVIIAFWEEFCSDENQKTILELLKEQEVSNPRSLTRLREYGFIIESQSKVDLRVPLFKQWLQRHAEAF